MVLDALCAYSPKQEFGWVVQDFLSAKLNKHSRCPIRLLGVVKIYLKMRCLTLFAFNGVTKWFAIPMYYNKVEIMNLL
jgi:hypothetical protein